MFLKVVAGCSLVVDGCPLTAVLCPLFHFPSWKLDIPPPLALPILFLFSWVSCFPASMSPFS
jgi:hypothetical protein